jgi:hypothetical protein
MNEKSDNFQNIIGKGKQGGIFIKTPLKQWKCTVL